MNKRLKKNKAASKGHKRAANVDVGELIRTGYALQTQGRIDESLKCLEQVLRAEPGNPDAIHLTSLGLTNQKKITDAVRFLRKWAAHPKSNNVATQYYIGYGYFLLKRYKLALEHLEVALAFEPGKAITRLLIARVLIGSGKPDSAVEFLQQGPAIVSRIPEDMMTYANVLTLLEQFEDAKKVLLKLLQSGSLTVQRLYDLILLPPETWSREHCEQVAEHLADPDLSARDKEFLNYAAARIADHRGQYQDAFRYFGNVKKLSSKAFDLGRLKRAVSTSVSDPARPATARSTQNPVITPVFILGLPRSGKTMLEKLLALNPEVAACGEITVRLFIDADIFIDSGGNVPANYEERLAGLKSTQCSMYATDYIQGVSEQYSLPETTRYLINTLPSNYLNIRSLSRIFPQGKFIFVTRDKRDLFVFNYMKHFRNNFSFTRDFASFTQYHDLIEEQIPNWQKQLGSNFLTVDYNDIVTSPVETLKQVCNFLEVADTGGSVSTLKLADIGFNDKHIGYWKNYQDLFPHTEADSGNDERPAAQ
ncbi:MAG: sulfotransferase [Pseudomonadota bacterium]